MLTRKGTPEQSAFPFTQTPAAPEGEVVQTIHTAPKRSVRIGV